MKSKKKKICFVSHDVYPLFTKDTKNGYGGAEVQLYMLGNKLKKNGFEISYIVGDYGQGIVTSKDGIKFIRTRRNFALYWPDVSRIHVIEILTRKIIRLFDNLICKWSVLRNKPDILIIRSASSAVGKWYLWCRLFGVRFIYMVAHEIDCSGEFEKWHPKAARKYRRGLKNADLVIAQNEEQKQLLKGHYGKDSIVMPSAYEIAPVKKKYDGFTLWVGRCEDWKRPEIFIELAKKFPQEKFVMIAPPARHKEDYYESIKRLCTEVPNLEFKSLIPFHEIDQYFKQAKIYVITSKYEGFPNTIIQAAKNKTAILSLNVNPNDIFNRHKIGFYAGDDLSLFYQEFGKLLAEKRILAKLGDNAFDYAKEHHNLNVIAKRYAKLFSEMIDKKR